VNQRKSPGKKWLVKGTAFESYVIGLFPRGAFSILHDTRQYANSEVMPRGVLDPDFRLLHKPSGHTFWVECKFRSSARYGVISWSSGSSQYERYLEFQEKVRPEKVYVVIGLIGIPSEPKFMYCIPLDEIEQPDVYVNKIVGYKRHPRGIFTYVRGRLR
jgi:hypothetical protein